MEQVFLQYGAIGLMAFYLYKKNEASDKKIEERDRLNREDTNKQINKLETTIEVNKRENKEEVETLRRENISERELFNKAIDSFNETANSFNKAVENFASTTNKVDRIECDVNEIKNKIK